MNKKTYKKPQMHSVEIDTENMICMSVNGTTDTALSKRHDNMWNDEGCDDVWEDEDVNP